MAVLLIGTTYVGEYLAAQLYLMMIFGEFLEDNTDKTRNAVKALIKLVPDGQEKIDGEYRRYL